MSSVYLLKLDFTDNDFSYIRKIRKKVFTTELGISESELFDESDKICDHFIILNKNSVIGTVRFLKILKKVKLERMAILNEFRMNHYGKDCILQLKEFYNTLGYTRMILDSIYSVIDFYKKCGFSEEGKIFQRVGIDHIQMSSNL
tara:strand:- start:22 stop:456 length:435 start_codon:yes stop_codon:yes gene_type:complete